MKIKPSTSHLQRIRMTNWEKNNLKATDLAVGVDVVADAVDAKGLQAGRRLGHRHGVDLCDQHDHARPHTSMFSRLALASWPGATSRIVTGLDWKKNEDGDNQLMTLRRTAAATDLSQRPFAVGQCLSRRHYVDTGAPDIWYPIRWLATSALPQHGFPIGWCTTSLLDHHIEIKGHVDRFGWGYVT